MNDNTKEMISLYKELLKCEFSFCDNSEVSDGISELIISIEKSLLKVDGLPSGTINWDKLFGKLYYGATIGKTRFKHWIRIESHAIMCIDDRSTCKIVQLTPDCFLVLYSETDTGNHIKLYLNRAELILSFHREKRQD